MTDTPVDLDELEALAKAATPGPWLRPIQDESRLISGPDGTESLLGLTEDNEAIVFAEGDAALIVAMRNALALGPVWEDGYAAGHSDARFAKWGTLPNPHSATEAVLEKQQRASRAPEFDSAKREFEAECGKSGLQKRHELNEELQKIDDAVLAAGGTRDQGAVAFLTSLTAEVERLKAELATANERMLRYQQERNHYRDKLLAPPADEVAGLLKCVSIVRGGMVGPMSIGDNGVRETREALDRIEAFIKQAGQR